MLMFQRMFQFQLLLPWFLGVKVSVVSYVSLLPVTLVASLMAQLMAYSQHIDMHYLFTSLVTCPVIVIGNNVHAVSLIS